MDSGQVMDAGGVAGAEGAGTTTANATATATATGEAHSTASTSSGQAGSGRDHRKNPRGRRHPLVALIVLGVQASRLLTRITQGTNPQVHNAEKFGDRLDRLADERYEREKAREPYNDFR